VSLSRRKFLRQTAALLPSAACVPSFAQALSAPFESVVRVKFNPSQTLAIIPTDFVGLGYEISSVARPGVLSSKNAVLVQLVQTLGKQGVIRVGGNTSDYASYAPNARPASVPESQGGSVVNDAVLRDLGGFLDRTGWQLIWSLNLGNGTEQNAIQEAKAVMATARDHLIAFEIGNEPDLFSAQQRHRSLGYTYDAYLREYRAFRDAIRKAIPHAQFAGPDAAIQTDWVVNFARDEGNDTKLLTQHYYREGQSASSTAEKLLHPDPKLAPMLEKLRRASESSQVPYRICETNSFSGGGKPGVSDTFASALWVLDFMFTLAAAGCAGVNMETGLNQLGFISSYSPIGEDEHGNCWAAPEYYGMLAFAQAGIGRIIGCEIDAGEQSIRAYATQPAPERLVLVVINKEPAFHAEILVDTRAFKPFRAASVCRLLASSLESKSGITLGGREVSDIRVGTTGKSEEIEISNNRLQVRVPAASAAVISLHH
jgi:hypothetical protein